MKKYKARIVQDKKLYIHNDVAQAAFYFKERVAARVRNNDREGLSYDRLACLIFSAFEIEAKANFLIATTLTPKQQKKLKWAKLKTKLKHLARKAKCKADFGSRPYKTIPALMTLRNTFAHGKPKIVHNVTDVTKTEKEILESGRLRAGWEDYLDDAFIAQSAEDVAEIWTTLLDGLSLSIADTFTQGGAEITFLEEK